MNESASSVSSRVPFGPIVEATIIVADLTVSIDAYTRGLGWQLEAPVSPLSRGDAHLLDADLVGCAFAVVRPEQPSATPGGVRLVEVAGVAPIEPLHTHGWSALELSVIDVESSTERAIAAGWRLLFKPVVLGGGTLPLVAAQLAGPSGECVYLTQILGEVEGFQLPTPVRDVDGIFIAVLGGSSLERSRGAIEDRFDVNQVSDRKLPVRVVNQQYGLPAGTLHRISSVQLLERTCIEVDQLPLSSKPRRAPGAGVPAGIFSVAVVSSAATSARRVELPDRALIEVRPRLG